MRDFLSLESETEGVSEACVWAMFALFLGWVTAALHTDLAAIFTNLHDPLTQAAATLEHSADIHWKKQWEITEALG